MIDLVRDKMDDIQALCRRFRVLRLELFGSAARGDFRQGESDIDFLVEYLPLHEGEHADFYFGLLESLEALLGCRVDLIMTRAIKNPYFLRGVNRKRIELYAA